MPVPRMFHHQTWDARNDARLLQKVRAIRGNPKRLKAAETALVEIEDEVERQSLEKRVAQQLKTVVVTEKE